jgi:putative ABC transport system permease protein
MIFSFLAALISCIGLFASINVRIEQSMKETGIRKILGAGLFQLLSKHLREYMIGIAIASMVAFPLTVVMLTDWLQEFAYKTSIDIVTVVESIILISALGCVAIAYQAIRILKLRPLESIRHE